MCVNVEDASSNVRLIHAYNFLAMLFFTYRCLHIYKDIGGTVLLLRPIKSVTFQMLIKLTKQGHHNIFDSFNGPAILTLS